MSFGRKWLSRCRCNSDKLYVQRRFIAEAARTLKEITPKGGHLPLTRDGKVVKNVEKRQTVFNVLCNGVADSRNPNDISEHNICCSNKYSIQQLRYKLIPKAG